MKFYPFIPVFPGPPGFKNPRVALEGDPLEETSIVEESERFPGRLMLGRIDTGKLRSIRETESMKDERDH